MTANIEHGNVGHIEWTVEGVSGQRTYSKMLGVDMKSDWQTYQLLIVTPEPAGQIESIRLIPSDERTEVTIRIIRLTRLNHLSPGT